MDAFTGFMFVLGAFSHLVGVSVSNSNSTDAQQFQSCLEAQSEVRDLPEYCESIDYFNALGKSSQ